MGRSRRASAAERLAQALTKSDGPTDLRTLLVHGPIANPSFDYAQTRPLARIEDAIAVDQDDDFLDDAPPGLGWGDAQVVLPVAANETPADPVPTTPAIAPRRRAPWLVAAAIAVSIGGLAAASIAMALRSDAPASTLVTSLAAIPSLPGEPVVEPEIDPLPPRSTVVERTLDEVVEEETIVVLDERRRGRTPRARRRALAPPRATGLVDEAATALEAGEREDAIELYERALTADPRSAAAAAGLSTAYFDQGRFDLATAWAEHAVKAEFRNPEYHVLLGDAYYRNAATDEARRQWETAAKLGSDRARDRLAKVSRP
jgi:tetratricopeptide (TPR) repeat protein